MPSVSATHLVLFIAAIVVSGALAGTMLQSSARVGDAIEANSQAQSEQVDAAISVVSDPESPTAVYNNTSNTLELYVKNVGADPLPHAPDDVAVLVNGTYQTDVRTTVLGDGDEWHTGALLRVRTNVSLPSNETTRVSVVVTGAQDYFTFTTA
ncbi:flagellin [Halobacterium zhouii]|uniref:flagellin n=1 Tax=Halobacterium zhouii TaxID=2902624 RepID=UPI001E52361A|nr:flagellin [Halobacterium zhouii]